MCDEQFVNVIQWHRDRSLWLKPKCMLKYATYLYNEIINRSIWNSIRRTFIDYVDFSAHRLRFALAAFIRFMETMTHFVLPNCSLSAIELIRLDVCAQCVHTHRRYFGQKTHTGADATTQRFNKFARLQRWRLQNWIKWKFNRTHQRHNEKNESNRKSHYEHFGTLWAGRYKRFPLCITNHSLSIRWATE